MNKYLLSLLASALFCTGYAEEVYKMPICGTLKPRASCRLGAQVSGRVEEVLCKEGQAVQQGQVLVKLDTTFFELDVKRQEALYRNAHVFYEEAQLEAQRMENLWSKPDPSVPKKLYDEAQFRLKQKKNLLVQSSTELKAARGRLKEASITAPFSGVITHCYIDRGDSVTSVPPVEVVELIDPSRLTFEFSIPQEKIGAVQLGAAVTFRMEGDSKTYTAPVTKAIPAIDEHTRSFRCQAEIENSGGDLKAGAFVRGTVELKG
ncbi:MAG TPA: efflux RND transporter periplasmic adaptor subunit [Rhabdochlamydiaceae bacterium]